MDANARGSVTGRAAGGRCDGGGPGEIPGHRANACGG
jgi:hypothetical protein